MTEFVLNLAFFLWHRETSGMARETLWETVCHGQAVGRTACGSGGAEEQLKGRANPGVKVSNLSTHEVVSKQRSEARKSVAALARWVPAELEPMTCLSG